MKSTTSEIRPLASTASRSSRRRTNARVPGAIAGTSRVPASSTGAGPMQMTRPSISALPEHAADMVTAAEWIADRLRGLKAKVEALRASGYTNVVSLGAMDNWDR